MKQRALDLWLPFTLNHFIQGSLEAEEPTEELKSCLVLKNS